MKTALCPLSSLTLSSRSTTLPLFPWRCVKFSTLHVAEIHKGCEMNESPRHFSLVELLLPWVFFFLEVAGRLSSLSNFLSSVALASGIVFVSLMGMGLYQAGLFLIQIHILFRLFGLCGFDAVVLLVLSCYLLTSISSGFFERQKICKAASSSSTLHGTTRS